MVLHILCYTYVKLDIIFYVRLDNNNWIKISDNNNINNVGMKRRGCLVTDEGSLSMRHYLIFFFFDLTILYNEIQYKSLCYIILCDPLRGVW